MKLFIDIVTKRIYLFNIVAWNFRKKIGFPVCKKENFAGLQAHRKRGKSARASPTPHHTLNEERSARFTAQHLSALVVSTCARDGWLQDTWNSGGFSYRRSYHNDNRADFRTFVPCTFLRTLTVIGTNEIHSKKFSDSASIRHVEM